MEFKIVMKRIFWVNLLGLFFPLLIFSISYAVYPENAEVLPKGISSVKVDSNFFLSITERYGPDGKVEAIAVDYNRSLNSNVFPSLAPLDPFVPGLPSIGDSIVSSEFHITEVYSFFYYGVTDKVTAGIMIPYWWVKNNIDARINSGPGSSANVGRNAAFACGSPICPLSVPGTVPLTTEDVQNLLGSGLDVNGNGTIDIPGFGLKRVETFSNNGLSDIEAGLKYQYLKTEDLRLAFTGGARFPTGKTDDPDNLIDYEFGSGAYALLFRLYNDYTGIKRLVLNGTIKYDFVLPDKQTKRVPDDVNSPITNKKGEVERDLGDKYQFEGSGKYTLLNGLDFYLIYNYRGKFKDRISGDQPFNFSSLEAETRRTEHIYEIGLFYTTIPLYKEKKFSFPFTTSVSYRHRFAGSDNVFNSKYIGLVLQTFF